MEVMLKGYKFRINYKTQQWENEEMNAMSSLCPHFFSPSRTNALSFAPCKLSSSTSSLVTHTNRLLPLPVAFCSPHLFPFWDRHGTIPLPPLGNVARASRDFYVLVFAPPLVCKIKEIEKFFDQKSEFEGFKTIPKSADEMRAACAA